MSINLQDGSVKTVAGYTFEGKVPITSMEMLDGDFLLTAPDAIARFDGEGRPKFHQSYKPVGNSAGTKAGAIAGYFLLGGFNPTPDTMFAAFAQRYSVSGSDDRDAYFLFENANGDAGKKFGIVCVERVTGKEIGTVWTKERNSNVILDPMSRTVYVQDDSKHIRAARF